MSAPTQDDGVPAEPAEPAVPATPGLLRTLNNRVVLDLFIRNGSLSRGDVRRLTGLSKPTASQLLSRLEASGLVLKDGFDRQGPGGRAAQLYVLDPTAGYAAAVDVTPSGTTAWVADITGTVVGRSHRSGAELPVGPQAAVAALTEAAKQAGIEVARLSAVVVGAPGSYDARTDELRFSDHLAGWQEPGLVARLTELTGTSVTIENDVNLVAVAEHHAEHDASATDPGTTDAFFLLWLDERIGGALVLGGELYRGSRGAAGEAAFLQVPGVPVVHHPARDNHGGFEDVAGEAAVRALASVHGLPSHDAATAISTAVADLTEPAQAFLDDVAARYALGLSSALALLDPALVILAGSLARAGGEELRARVARALPTVSISAPPLRLGRAAQTPILTGALMLSLDHARDRVFAT